MKLNTLLKGTGLALVALTFANLTHASSVSRCNSTNGDFGDAPASYGVACHDTNRWQQFGDAGTPLPGDTGAPGDFENGEWTSETSSNTVDMGDGGVSWRTSVDGNTWSSYGQSDALVVGEFVEFKVDVQRADSGNHNFDAYRVWLDWFGTGTFDHNDDLVLDGQWEKDEDSEGNVYTGTDTAPSSSVGFNSPDTFGEFLSGVIQVPLNAALGETWLRARVACDWSFNGSNGNALFATGYYHQGEVEDYALRIVERVVDVNAPATGAMLALVVAGLFVRRQTRS